MKIWKLISLLLLAAFLGACDDDVKEADDEMGGATGTDVEVRFGYEAKTVLKNGGQVQVPVKLAKAISNTVKVTIAAEKASADTDAREGIDFNLPEKIVTIPAGDTVGYVVVDLLDNGKADNDRIVKLNMTGVYGGKPGTPGSVLLHIVSNAFVEFEKAKWETWESANVETSSEEVRNSRLVPLIITGEITEPATIVFEVTDSSAIEPTHFTVEKELVVTPGMTRVNVEIKPVDDEEVNDDRIFILKIKEIKGSNLLIGKNNVNCEVKILSEEILRNLSWEKVSQETTDEESIIRIPVSLNKVPLAAFTVDIVADGESDAVKNLDYEILTPQVSIDASRQAIVEVKVLNNREVNADRKLILKFANITDNTVFVKDNAKSFTLEIKNSDFPVFVGGGEAIEDKTNEVSISIPAVNRERVITLSYSSTESVAGTYFTLPAETITVPAGAESVKLPVVVKYTNEFPAVVPEFTMSIVKVDDVVLENTVNTTLVLTPCDYRKLLGVYVLSQQGDNIPAGFFGDITVSAGDNDQIIRENFNQKLVCKGTFGGFTGTFYIMFISGTAGEVIFKEQVLDEKLDFGTDGVSRVGWGLWSNLNATRLPVIFNSTFNIITWDTKDNVCLALLDNPGKVWRYGQNFVMTKK